MRVRLTPPRGHGLGYDPVLNDPDRAVDRLVGEGQPLLLRVPRRDGARAADRDHHDAMTQRLTPDEYDALPWLHVYAQDVWHDEARIVGTREALIALREAIDRALAEGKAEAEAIAGDGEGYGVEIACASRQTVQDAPLPYTKRYARGRQ